MNKEKTCFIRSSINIDQYFRVENIVRAGETISSVGFTEKIGGKGANTAVAISKAGQLCHFSGLIDRQSSWLKQKLNHLGVDVTQLNVCHNNNNDDDESKLATGRAIIQVSEETGENAIILVPGVNHASAKFWPDIKTILDSNVYSHVLVHNEISINETVSTLKLAHSLGITTIFNPSPVPNLLQIQKEIPWNCIDWLILNQEEARILKEKSVTSSNRILNDEIKFEFETKDNSNNNDNVEFEFEELEILKHLVRLSMANFSIVITLGARGSIMAYRRRGDWKIIATEASAESRAVIDTTGAGDCFTGFLVAELMKLNLDTMNDQDQLLDKFQKSLRVAHLAARFCVENSGTIDSYASLDHILQSHNNN